MNRNIHYIINIKKGKHYENRKHTRRNKVAFEDKRIVVVRGGNMSHRDDYVKLEGFKY
jgi:hypothetical protein